MSNQRKGRFISAALVLLLVEVLLGRSKVFSITQILYIGLRALHHLPWQFIFARSTTSPFSDDNMVSTKAPFVVVICSGSYHTPEPYLPFIQALKEKGIDAYCPQLPSSDLSKMNVGDIQNPDYERDPPSSGYPQPADDAVVLTQLLHSLIVDSSKHVIVIGHSSGGFVATYISVLALQAKKRKAEGKAEGIIGIFYEAAFLIPVGESVHSFFQPKDGSDPIIPPYSVVHVSFFAISHSSLQR